MELTMPHTVFQACSGIALWRFLYIGMTSRNKALRKSLRVAGQARFT